MRSYELVSFTKLSNNTGSTEAPLPRTRSIEPAVILAGRHLRILENKSGYLTVNCRVTGGSS